MEDGLSCSMSTGNRGESSVVGNFPRSITSLVGYSMGRGRLREYWGRKCEGGIRGLQGLQGVEECLHTSISLSKGVRRPQRSIVSQSDPYQLEGSPLKVGDRVIKLYSDGDEVAGTVRGFRSQEPPDYPLSMVLINYDDGVKGVGTPLSTLRREPLPDIGGFRVGDRIIDSGWLSHEPSDSLWRHGTITRLENPRVVVDWDKGAKGHLVFS